MCSRAFFTAELKHSLRPGTTWSSEQTHSSPGAVAARDTAVDDAAQATAKPGEGQRNQRLGQLAETTGWPGSLRPGHRHTSDLRPFRL
jgi:hypothetical protein